MRPFALVGVCLLISLAGSASGAPATTALQSPAIALPKAVEVSTTRVHLHDLGVNVLTVPDIDLGPAPALGTQRTVDRDEIVRALGAANASGPTPALSAQYRITRKAKKLDRNDLEKLVRDGIDPARLTKGIAFVGVRSPGVQVPFGYDRVTVELPALAKRSGTVSVTASVAFLTDNDISARIMVAVDLTVPPQALVPDVAKGGPITLVIRRGLVEVSMPAFAAADGDLGTIVPILLKPSGRTVRAKMIDKDHAVSVEES